MTEQEQKELAWKARLDLEKMGDQYDITIAMRAKSYLDRIAAAVWLKKNTHPKMKL